MEVRRKKKKKNSGSRRYRFYFVALLILAIGSGSFYWYQDSQRIRIAIDPGHGGLDVGAIGIVNEAEINERTAKALFELLDADSRFKPIYTRKFKSDVKYSLADRIELANRKKAKILLSIHANSNESKRTRGFECYASPPGRKNHEESVRLAGIIAQKMGEAGHVLRGENGVRFMYYVKTKDNKERLEIKESSYTNVDRTDAGMAMVENPDCPSVLVEQCFVTNKEDYDAWGSEEGSIRAAKVYYDSVCDYFELD